MANNQFNFLVVFFCGNCQNQLIQIVFYKMQGKSQLKNQPIKKDSIKLHYFYIRGACQPLRNLLYYLQIEFEDIMYQINRENQIEVGFNMGMPFLQDNDLRIHETIAIMYYICKKYQRQNLIGLTPQSIAKIQQILMKFCVQRKRIMSYVFEMFTSLPSKSDKEAYIDSILKKMVSECKFLQYCLRCLAKGKKYILDNITLIDFIFYEKCFYICGFFQQYIIKSSIFKLFIEFKENFQKLPFFAKNKQKIQQKYLFHEFTNAQMNKSIADSWKGAKCGNLLKKQSQA